jgi:hypothetical protein
VRCDLLLKENNFIFIISALMAYGSKHREEEDRQREEEKRRKENESNGQCCKCEESVEDLAKKARERNMQIEFENFLHNSVYLKR